MCRPLAPSSHPEQDPHFSGCRSRLDRPAWGHPASRRSRRRIPIRGRHAMYDVLVVGARCAGAPTALLLARRGFRVLLVDRATFPSDTMSTHYVKRPAIAQLKRWGLLDRVIASGCPPIHRIAFDV